VDARPASASVIRNRSASAEHKVAPSSSSPLGVELIDQRVLRWPAVGVPRASSCAFEARIRSGVVNTSKDNSHKVQAGVERVEDLDDLLAATRTHASDSYEAPPTSFAVL